MLRKLQSINSYAEELGNLYFSESGVDLISLAKANSIEIIEGKYGNSFVGLLVCVSNEFYIILNQDLLQNSEYSRVRFTIAHELGHFFIKPHQELLKQGQILSFRGDNKKLEIEANSFAAHLMMPPKIFKSEYYKSNPGFTGLNRLKELFLTSMESTLIHTLNLDLLPSMMIKWRPDFTAQYVRTSDSLLKLLKYQGSWLPIKNRGQEVRKKVIENEFEEVEFSEQATRISDWTTAIPSFSDRNLLGIEQTRSLGSFGAITLLYFIQ